jgi:hypothetical protein
MPGCEMERGSAESENGTISAKEALARPPMAHDQYSHAPLSS